MINKDYILRLAEQIGYEISILVGLRKRDRYEDELLTIDNLLLKFTGMTSRFINSLSDEMFLQSLSPMGKINVEVILWISALLKEEGEAYDALNNSKESYYRYVKSLYLLLELLHQEHIPFDSPLYEDAKDLIEKLASYELPAYLQREIFRYYEQIGMYDQAENILFDYLEKDASIAMLTLGKEFYQRLLTKNTLDLQNGNFSLEEVHEGLEQLKNFQA